MNPLPTVDRSNQPRAPESVQPVEKPAPQPAPSTVAVLNAATQPPRKLEPQPPVNPAAEAAQAKGSAYLGGFLQKCAEEGVDARLLLRRAILGGDRR